MKTKLELLALAAIAMSLVACGSDGGNGSGPSNADQIVASYEDLTLCTAKREGTTAYVKDEKAEYVCSNGDWVPVDGVGSSGSVSSAADLSSASDGIGTDSAEIVEIRNKTIKGVSQKGPFVNGSSVTVQELDGKTLAQTGKSFKGRISNDKGEFAVSSISLASQYALLEATGYYLNENTGRKSGGTITLNAFVDLSKRENVNINLLTHLEYERALHLISTSKGVAAAKKQAEGEIFKAFGVTGDFANSEELDILAKGEGDAALLAISVLMQGDLSEAELSERLANFADDIEQDGTWDDAATRAQIADWASTADLAAIRTTVEGWNAENKAPAFEPAVKEFWWNEYGLGLCAVSNDGEIKQNVNSRSANNDIDYICDTGDWRVATIGEYDTYRWNAEADGSTKEGQVTEALYKYDSLQTQWIAANALDTALGLNGCTQKRETEVGKGCDNNDYICISGLWRNATWLNSDIPYGSMTDERDGQTYLTVSIGSQTWMAENLNYEYKVGVSTYGNQCDDRNDTTSNCAKYGRVYTWGAAMDSATTGCGGSGNYSNCTADTGRVRGVCPNGWHLPDSTEWDVLFTAVGGQSTAATALTSANGWSFYSNIPSSTNSSGFSAAPSPYCNATLVMCTRFWSSSKLIGVYMDRSSSAVWSGQAASSLRASVRCVKD